MILVITCRVNDVVTHPQWALQEEKRHRKGFRGCEFFTLESVGVMHIYIGMRKSKDVAS